MHWSGKKSIEFESKCTTAYLQLAQDVKVKLLLVPLVLSGKNGSFPSIFFE